jgi:RNA-directed DNA polymerase
LFLHYVFDMWMVRNFPDIPFERYADDLTCHCRSAEEARVLWSALEARFVACRLVLHPQKTKLVYCKDANRRGDYPTQSFDFLGYEFRSRSAVWRGRQLGVSFLPAASPKALKAMRQTVRQWALYRRSDKALDDLARIFNPYIQGWINYYGHFYRSVLLRNLQRIDTYLVRWGRYKYRRLRAQTSGARSWFARVVRTNPTLFAHWRLLYVRG